MNEIQRRRFLLTLSAGATLLIPGWAMGKNKLWVPDDLPITPHQTEGPFYPETTIEQQLHSDTDLRRKLEGHEFAKGQSAIVEGAIKNQKGAPLKEAVVEVWQACATGRYNHKRDAKNPSLLDNNFQFWGRAITGEDGKYSFVTIIPGKYPGRTARHIHFRVDAAGYRRCSTQCYFSDFGKDNLRDGIYTSLNRLERGQVTVEFDKPTEKENASDGGKSEKNASETKTTKTADSAKVTNEKTVVETPWRGSFDVVLAKR